MQFKYDLNKHIVPNITLETHTSYNKTFTNQSKCLEASGPNLCKFYSRPVNSKIKPGDIIEDEYEFKSEELVSPEKITSHANFVTVAIQTDFRESETQTDPWDPPFVVKKTFKDPEVLHLKELSYGKGLPFTQTEIEYIIESKQNRDLDVPSETIVNYENFLKRKQLICSQVQNKWNYKISKHSEELLDKLKQMEMALAQELTIKSERQERLLKSLWTQKKDQMTKTNSKLQKELNKEIKLLERKYKDGGQTFNVKAYGLDHTAKEIAHLVNENKESLNRDIDCLISKYHMNPNGLSKLTSWLEKKRTLLYNEVPSAKPYQKNQREKLTERAYQDHLVSKRTKMPPKVYQEDYDDEESMTVDVKSEVEFEILQLPEEGVDLVTVWQQVLRGRAYQKQMLELIAKHKDTLDVLLSSQIQLQRKD